jgi:hypothetical protein
MGENLERRESWRFEMTRKSNAKLYYYLMIASMLVRLFWLVTMEPNGASRALERFPSVDTIEGLAVHTLPYIVYPSMVILVVIILAALLKKKWAYVAGIVFGATHFVLTLALAVLHGNPGYGPAVVLPTSALMVVFSTLAYRAEPVQITAQEPA